MKVCVLNFSGNAGKSTIAAHLLQPRLNAQVFSVESLNVDASSDGVEVARLSSVNQGEKNGGGGRLAGVARQTPTPAGEELPVGALRR